MANPPDLQRAHEILAEEAPAAFAFLRDEGFEQKDAPRLSVEFRSRDRRLVLRLRARRSELYRQAEVYLGPLDGEVWSLDELATDIPDDITPAPGPGGGPNIDDEADVAPAVRHLAERVRAEWLGFLRADAGVFDRFLATRDQRVRRQRTEEEDSWHAERGRAAFEDGDDATAVTELEAATALAPADAKRLEIARRRTTPPGSEV